MSALTKEQWEARDRAVARRNAENAKIGTLTEGQHRALAGLCAFRHDLHCGASHMWLSESAEGRRIWDGLGEWDAKLADAGLPEIGLDSDEYITDVTWHLDFESEAEAMEALAEFVGRQNALIEAYLRRIDGEHGTRYEPTGAHRALMMEESEDQSQPLLSRGGD